MVCAIYPQVFFKEYPTEAWVKFKDSLEGSVRWVKNYTFGFNLSFGFFSQCSLHIHASYSISQKLNVPMAPLSEPKAVGIVIAHGKQPPRPPSPREPSAEHTETRPALNPVRKPPYRTFTILRRISYMIMILRVFPRERDVTSPFPKFCGLFFFYHKRHNGK